MAQAIQPAGITAVDPFAQERYVARRNFFNFLGVTCRMLTLDGRLLCKVHQKAFRLKENITIFADEGQTQPLLTIQARQIFDFSAAYDVVDNRTGEKVGALKRKGLKSMLRDEWAVLDVNDNEVGKVQEDSMLLALLRRFLSNLIPQNYTFELHGQPVADVQGTWNPFIVRYTIDLTRDQRRALDRRLAMAAAVLLLTIEGKQN